MSETITITVAGVPHGRPRPLARARQGANGKWFAQVYQPKKPSRRGTKAEKRWAKANAWAEAVRAATFQKMPAEPWTGPISLTIDAYFPRPQDLMRKKDPEGPILHTVKPDRDNIDKAVMDALKEAGLFKDDCQVCQGAVRKWYHAKSYGPGVVIVATKLDAAEVATLYAQA